MPSLATGQVPECGQVTCRPVRHASLEPHPISESCADSASSHIFHLQTASAVYRPTSTELSFRELAHRVFAFDSSQELGKKHHIMLQSSACPSSCPDGLQLALRSQLRVCAMRTAPCRALQARYRPACRLPPNSIDCHVCLCCVVCGSGRLTL